MAQLPGTDYHIVSLSETKKEAFDLISTGFPEGNSPGFKSSEKKIGFRPGFTTLIYGPPHHGKSQVAKEFSVNLSRKYGIKHLMRVPEWGSEKEAFVDLMQTYMGCVFFGDDKPFVDIKKLDEAFEFVDAHFLLLPNPKKQKKSRILDKSTILDDYQVVELLKERGRFDVGMLWIDHFKWWKKPDEWKMMQTAEYVTECSQTMNVNSAEMQIHTVLLNHTAQQDLVVDKDSGKRFLPKPHMAEIAQGQEWSKNGQQIISVYRPVEGVIDRDSGMAFRKNQIVLSVDKSVPKGIGEAGTQVTLFFDRNTQRFYEEINQDIFYGLEFEQLGGKKSPPPPLISSKLGFKWAEDQRLGGLFDQEEAPF